MRALAPVQDEVPSRKKLEELLKQRSTKFVHQINARQISTPWAEYASPDYIHHYTTPSGDLIDMTAEQTMQFFRQKFEEYPDYQWKIVDTTVHLEHGDKPTYATVWQTVVVKNGGDPGERERVAIYSWRRETDKYGMAKWVWWRQECPSTAAVVPF